MRYFSNLLLTLFLFIGASVSDNALSATSLISSQSEYKDVAKTLKAGDTIVLANGEWKDFEILLVGQGTTDQPITLTAEEKGKVIISGKSNLRMAGEHLLVSGWFSKTVIPRPTKSSHFGAIRSIWQTILVSLRW